MSQGEGQLDKEGKRKFRKQKKSIEDVGSMFCAVLAMQEFAECGSSDSLGSTSTEIEAIPHDEPEVSEGGKPIVPAGNAAKVIPTPVRSRSQETTARNVAEKSTDVQPKEVPV